MTRIYMVVTLLFCFYTGIFAIEVGQVSNTDKERSLQQEEDNNPFKQNEFIKQYGDLEVVTIKVLGLRRTSEKTFLRWFDLKAKQTVSNYNLEQLFKDIDDKNLFSMQKSVDFYERDSKAYMVVQVDEKWSLIPVPFYSTDGDKSLYGGALLDSNLFGQGNTLLAALAVGSSSITTFGMYSMKNILDKKYNFQLLFSYRNNDIEMSDIDEEFYLKNRALFATSRVIFTRNLLNKQLKIGPRLGFNYGSIDEDWDDSINNSRDHTLGAAGFSIEYDNTERDFVFNVGSKVTLTSEYYHSFKDYEDDFVKQDFKASYSTMLIENINLSFHTQGGLFDKADLVEDELGGHFGAKSLPSGNIYADNWVDGAIVFEIPVWKKGKFHPTISAFYEGGYYDYEGGVEEYISFNQKYHGIGGEFRVYFDKVALPALGFSYAYNFASKSGHLNFSIGMGGN